MANTPFGQLPGPDLARVGELRGLLDRARALSATDPMGALEHIIAALRIQGGEGAVMRAMQNAREAYWSQHATDSFTEQMSAFVLQELQQAAPVAPAPEPTQEDLDAITKHSLLEELGHTSILESAARSANNVVCARCGGLVAADRKAAHDELWCPALD
eukprot:m.10350 g.10350  ORF g.10350 m.10350 type:complete len:159 (-) comp2514_c0_seq1:120-596(-)